jgi:hypothetical protein
MQGARIEFVGLIVENGQPTAQADYQQQIRHTAFYWQY